MSLSKSEAESVPTGLTNCVINEVYQSNFETMMVCGKSVMRQKLKSHHHVLEYILEKLHQPEMIKNIMMNLMIVQIHDYLGNEEKRDHYVEYCLFNLELKSDFTEEDGVVMDVLMKIIPQNIRLLRMVAKYIYYAYNDFDCSQALYAEIMDRKERNETYYECMSEYATVMSIEIKKKIMKTKEKSETIFDMGYGLRIITEELLSTQRDHKIKFEKTLMMWLNSLKFCGCNSKEILDALESMVILYKEHSDSILILRCWTLINNDQSMRNVLEVNRLLKDIDESKLSTIFHKIYHCVENRSELSFKNFKNMRA